MNGHVKAPVHNRNKFTRTLTSMQTRRHPPAGLTHLVELAGGREVVLLGAAGGTDAERLRHGELEHVLAAAEVGLAEELQEADGVVRLDAHGAPLSAL